jgi:hypothetical protein
MTYTEAGRLLLEQAEAVKAEAKSLERKARVLKRMAANTEELAKTYIEQHPARPTVK